MSWPKFWYKKNWQSQLLSPLGALVCWEASRRLHKFQSHLPAKPKQDVPVIVVGNLVVGGSGKTPFIIGLVRYLKAKGLKVGLISRGYGGQSKQWPVTVNASSDPHLVGDEPVMLVQQLDCPMVVSPKRLQAYEQLVETESVDVVISDDGLQHFALPRTLEVVVFDSTRLWGNGRCMPAGPLREPLQRLTSVDFIVYNGMLPEASVGPQGVESAVSDKSFAMQLRPLTLKPLLESGQQRALESFSGQSVQAMAGIGNPQRFYDSLRAAGLEVEVFDFADHHDYELSDFAGMDSEKPLLMTQKDAVKCRRLKHEASGQQRLQNAWFLEVESVVDEQLLESIFQRLSSSGLPEPGTER